MSKTTATALSVQDQFYVKSNLRTVLEVSPWYEKFFIMNGPVFASIASAMVSFVAWRHSFVGFGLAKFGAGRVMTLVPVGGSVLLGGGMHMIFVQGSLFQYYRSENYLNYGTKSVLCHQANAFLGSIFIVGSTFMSALTVFILPTVNPRFYKIRHLRPTLGVISSKIGSVYRPFFKTLGLTSVAMFLLGLAEYDQSRIALAKINRRTLHLKEDQ